jgi:methyl-accepting chemotaxis protein
MFARMKIGTKILSSYGLVSVLMVALLITVAVSLSTLARYSQKLAQQLVPNLISVSTLNLAETDVSRALFGLSKSTLDARHHDALWSQLEPSFKLIETTWAEYEARPKTEKVQRAFDEMKGPWNRWLLVARKTADLLKEQDRLIASQGRDSPQVKSLTDRIVVVLEEQADAFSTLDPYVQKLQISHNDTVGAQSDLAESSASSYTVILSVAIAAIVLLILLVGMFVARDVGRVFATISEHLGRIARGDMSQRMTETRGNDFNAVRDSLNTCIDVINDMVAETGALTRASIEGKLATRADPEKFQGDYRKVVQGLNETLDAVIGPLNVAAEYVDRISKGDIPAKITDAYKGDFNEIKNNLNGCIEAVQHLVTEANLLTRAAVEGHLATRADASKFQGDYRKIVQGVNDTLDAVIGPLNVSAEYVDRISKGDIPPKITDAYKGDFNEIKNNLNTCIDAVGTLVAEADALTRAAVEGKLSTRADASKVQGDYRKIVQGVNATLDAVIGPLNVSAEYVDRISKGDIPPRITDAYKGDFNEIKNNLNGCIDNLNVLIDENDRMAKAQEAGDIDAFMPVERFQGAYRTLAEKGINAQVASHITVKKRIVEVVRKFGDGDFSVEMDRLPGKKAFITEGVNLVRGKLMALASDTRALVEAAKDGKLTTRADASRHQGEFRGVVDGVNATLDAVIAPVQELAQVLEKVAAGDLTTRVSGDYRGDFNLLKSSANSAIQQIRSVIDKIAGSTTMLATASEELSKTSEQMSGNAEETSSQAGVVSAASEQVNKNAQTVATSAEEMSASIREIAINSGEAARVAGSAVRLAEGTNTTIGKLGQSSAEIGQVIKVITSIAQQTNLLALNATIEAARAGEAGKGFAVVANEVKELAKETAKATEDISRKIEAIQGDTKSAVDAITQIGGVIKQINDIQTTIAGAVEEQSATTSSIERNAAEAAKASGEIARNITGVAQAAANTASGASNTQVASQGLAKMATELQTAVGRFKI